MSATPEPLPDLSEALKDTLLASSELSLSPSAVSALCTIRIGVSSLAEVVTPGCGIEPLVREIIEELVLVLEIAKQPSSA